MTTLDDSDMQSQLQANCACTNLNLLLRLALCGDDHTPVSPGFRVLHTGAGVGRKAASRHVQHVLTIISFIATLPPVTVQPATAPVYTTTQTMHMKPKMTSLLVNKFKAT